MQTAKSLLQSASGTRGRVQLYTVHRVVARLLGLHERRPAPMGRVLIEMAIERLYRASGFYARNRPARAGRCQREALNLLREAHRLYR